MVRLGEARAEQTRPHRLGIGKVNSKNRLTKHHVRNAVVIAAVGLLIWHYGFLLAKLTIGSAYVVKRVGTATLTVNGKSHDHPLFVPVFRRYPEQPRGLLYFDHSGYDRRLGQALLVYASPLGLGCPNFSDDSFAKLPFGYALLAEISLLGVSYDSRKTETRLETHRAGDNILFTCFDLSEDRPLFSLEIGKDLLNQLR